MPATCLMERRLISMMLAGRLLRQGAKARPKLPGTAAWWRFPNPSRLRPDRHAHLVSFQATANGPMPEIIYFNGRRVALGDDLEPIVLFDKAKPGEKVLVAVKLLHTVDKKTFGGARLKIDFRRARPNPEDLRMEFLRDICCFRASRRMLTRRHSNVGAGGQYGRPAPLSMRRIRQISMLR